MLFCGIFIFTVGILTPNKGRSLSSKILKTIQLCKNFDFSHKIGFLTCLLLRYSKGVHPSKVAQIFGVDRGTVHRYWQTVITEASRLSVFTNLIDEFWFFSPFFEKLVHKLSYSQYPELAELLVIPSLPVEKAKLLYEADLTSPALIVDADEGKNYL